MHIGPLLEKYYQYLKFSLLVNVLLFEISNVGFKITIVFLTLGTKIKNQINANLWETSSFNIYIYLI